MSLPSAFCFTRHVYAAQFHSAILSFPAVHAITLVLAEPDESRLLAASHLTPTAYTFFTTTRLAYHLHWQVLSTHLAVRLVHFVIIAIL